MLRRLPTIALMTALSGALFMGCQVGGSNETPIRIVPDVPANPGVQVGVELPGPAPLTANAFGSSVGVSNAPGAKFFQAGSRQSLFLGCPGDKAEDGTIVDNYRCDDFLCKDQAKAFFDALRQLKGPNTDCHGLDGSGASQANGIPCDGAGLPDACP